MDATNTPVSEEEWDQVVEWGLRVTLQTFIRCYFFESPKKLKLSPKIITIAEKLRENNS